MRPVAIRERATAETALGSLRSIASRSARDPAMSFSAVRVRSLCTPSW
jgi:hypothetical protein